jgi:hypothetical protein
MKINFHRCSVKSIYNPQECWLKNGTWYLYESEIPEPVNTLSNESTLDSVDDIVKNNILSKLNNFQLLANSIGQTNPNAWMSNSNNPAEFYLLDKLNLLQQITINHIEDIYINKGLFESAKVMDFDITHNEFLDPLIEINNFLKYPVDRINNLISIMNNAPSFVPTPDISLLIKEWISGTKLNSHFSIRYYEFILAIYKMNPDINIEDVPVKIIKSEMDSIKDNFGFNSIVSPENYKHLDIGSIDLYEYNMMYVFIEITIINADLFTLLNNVEHSYENSQILKNRIIKGLDNYSNLNNINSNNEYQELLIKLADTDVLNTINEKIITDNNNTVDVDVDDVVVDGDNVPIVSNPNPITPKFTPDYIWDKPIPPEPININHNKLESIIADTNPYHKNKIYNKVK